jgi:hypothetical protein
MSWSRRSKTLSRGCSRSVCWPKRWAVHRPGATVYQPPRSARLSRRSWGTQRRDRRATAARHCRPAAKQPGTMSRTCTRNSAEADLLLLNKVDLLMADELTQTSAAGPAPPGCRCYRSAPAPEGIGDWVERLVESPGAGARVLDLTTTATRRRGRSGLAEPGRQVLHGRCAGGGRVRSVLMACDSRPPGREPEIAHVGLWVEPPAPDLTGGAIVTARRWQHRRQ